MGTRRIKTRKMLLSILIISLVVLAILSFVSMLLGGIERAVKGLTRIELGQMQEVDLLEPGTYAVFWEQGHKLARTDLRIVQNSAETAVEFQEPRLSRGYSIRGQRGEALGDFTIEDGGSYLIIVDNYQGPSTITLGRGYYRQMISTILGSVAVLAVVMVVLVIIAFKQLQDGFERIISKLMRE